MTQNTAPNISHGLSSAEAAALLKKHGKNRLEPQKSNNIFLKIIHVILEPMFLFLIAAAVIYFILGEPSDGLVMLVFVAAIIGIDTVQQYKTDKTLLKLKTLSSPKIKVRRDGIEKTIESEDLVPGDIMLISEGIKIPADGKILKSNDLFVDESSLTGEAGGIWKGTEEKEEPLSDSDYFSKQYCYAGTLVLNGSATVLVEKTGVSTQYGKIGKAVAEAPQRPTPLEVQAKKLIQSSACIAAVLFVLVVIITFFNITEQDFTRRITDSVLSGITLAMAMIPEEFPVIMAVFLSMGAWRLAKKNSIVRNLPSVETLGSVSVLCVDKTGTITQNIMTVTQAWDSCGDNSRLIKTMGMACETDTYDPMEKAMLNFCLKEGLNKDELFGGRLLKEYPFTSEQKMMGHVWERDGKITIAAKGSTEGILPLCILSQTEKETVNEKIESMSQMGLRVIAVASADIPCEGDVPSELELCRLNLCGIVGLFDPPRESVKQDIDRCIKAGIRVVMITGDNGVTAGAIAQKAGMPNWDKIITGAQLDQMNEEELLERVKYTNIFSRVTPEHKMRIVKALKQNGETVAMTGDGVNDAPALKYADIGIAMGKRGSEVSREAADLILLDDNFSTIVDTVADGRRIYDNIKKAVGYVLTIHIPIALISLLAPLLKIPSAALFFLPLHVVLLELVIDPTCSIVLERQPPERGIMSRPPRDKTKQLLSLDTFLKSLIQGIFIFAAAFITYFVFYNAAPENSALARTMGFCIIVVSNMLLVLVNSSNTDLAVHSLKYFFKDKVILAINISTVLMLILVVYSPVNSFLKFAPLSGMQFLLIIMLSFVSVLWYDIIKIYKRRKIKK